ncbi:MAG: Xaa-Pro peptidase family protein [Alicyclobacillus sp.]|nr:Xaa-Pro peptidase family protein [Alicyclobacillus sp.]
MYHEFIQGKHEHQPRRIYSTTGTDWQERVNFDRMRRERLEKVREQMDKHNLGAMILFVGENVRYVTGVWQGNWKNNIFIRYAVLPRNGDPVLFETVGSDMVCAKMDAPWLGEGNIRPAITWRWAEGAEQSQVEKMAQSVYQVLVEHKVEKEQVGIDVMDMMAYQAFTNLGVRLVNAWPAMKDARVIKTPDEIECLKIAAAHGDAAMWMAMNEWAKPGVTEREVSAKVNEYLYRRGFDFVYDIIVASGGNTSPYRRWATDKLLRVGDLVIIDINAIGPGGYFIDFVRCFKVGGVKPTQKELDLYKECYESLYRAIEKMKPGNTTADVAAEFPEYDDDKYGTVSLQQFAHSIGLTLYEGMWVSRAYSMKYPAEIKPNMYFAIETFAGHPGLEQTVRLEENLVITDTGNAITTLCPHQEEFMAYVRG